MTTLRLLAAALCTASALATSAVAQETDGATEPSAGTDAAAGAQAGDADAPAPGTEVGPATAIPASPLNTGRAVGEAATGEAEAAQGPTIYVREEHGDWEVRCLEAPEGQDDPCQLYQRLSDQQGNPTADVNFFVVPEGGEVAGGATILTPLQTLLTAAVTIQVDGGEARRYPYSFCDRSGCYARLGFTAEDMARFRRGAAATVTVVPALAPDQPAETTMSLSGFTAGFEALSN